MTRYRQKKIVEAEQVGRPARLPWLVRVGSDLGAFFDAPSATTAAGDWIVTLDAARGVRVVVPDATFRELYEPVVESGRATPDGEPEEPPRAWRPEDWVETVAMPLRLAESGDTLEVTCPFCGIRIMTPFCATCDHYRRFHERAHDSRLYAVFEGTPVGRTHVWKLTCEAVRIIGGGPDWFEVQGDSEMVVHRDRLRRIPYVDGIILSSRGNPLGDKE